MRLREIPTVIRIRRIVRSYVAGDRNANAMSDVVTGRKCGGSLW